MAVKAPAGGSLEAANCTRRGTMTATPWDLWQLAHAETDGSVQARREHFRHAMIHAGHLLNSRGVRYKRCPVCRGSLTA